MTMTRRCADLRGYWLVMTMTHTVVLAETRLP
jgi:hypothetical protein